MFTLASDLKEIKDAFRSSKERLLLLDYDGTLVPFAKVPELANPSVALIGVIKRLSSDKANRVVIISGRTRPTLDSWFKGIELDFAAEYGAFHKRGGNWQAILNIDVNWKNEATKLMKPYLKILAGSLIEEKETAIVFHYRAVADKSKTVRFTKQLDSQLATFAKKHHLDYLHHKKTLELKQPGADKNSSAKRWLNSSNFDFILCAGDSISDEAMFDAVKHKGFCIKVGQGKTAAKYRLESPGQFIEFLKQLAYKS